MSLSHTRSMACAIAALACGLGAATAHAQTETAPFERCPTGVDACFTAITKSGSFRVGSLEMRITSPMVLRGGLGPEVDGFSAVLPPRSGPALEGQALDVPGGLLGVKGLQSLIPGVTDVKATTLLAGTPRLNLLNVLFGDGVGLELPVRIKLDNLLLGPNCTIGTTAQPVRLQLTTGTTAPPAPNTPITGDRGEIGLLPDGATVKASGSRLVDNAFAVPEASGCSPLGLSLLDQTVSRVVNSRQGLPSAAGRNAAVLVSDSYIGPPPATP